MRTPRPPGRLLWVHAASVGETASILPVLPPLLAGAPDLTVLVTTGTVTAARLLAQRLTAGADSAGAASVRAAGRAGLGRPGSWIIGGRTRRPSWKANCGPICWTPAMPDTSA